MSRPRLSLEQVNFIIKMMTVEYSTGGSAESSGRRRVRFIRYRVKRALAAKKQPGLKEKIISG